MEQVRCELGSREALKAKVHSIIFPLTQLEASESPWAHPRYFRACRVPASLTSSCPSTRLDTASSLLASVSPDTFLPTRASFVKAVPSVGASRLPWPYRRMAPEPRWVTKWPGVAFTLGPRLRGAHISTPVLKESR